MKQEQIDQMQLRQTYQNFWHIQLTQALTTDPGFCCFATWCPPCASYQLRRRALYGDMTRYVCCGGYMPCSGKVKEQQCPEFCLGVEACCCFVQSVMVTRWMLQDEFRIQTTPCDNCLITFMIVLKQISCICNVLACLTGSDELKEIAHCMRLISDIVTCSVTSSMLTQQKIEMDKRDGLIQAPPVMGVPPVQQMSRMSDGMEGPPPPNGYPPNGMGGPPPPNGYPPNMMGGPPPPNGYPPSGYPPSAYPPSGYPPNGLAAQPVPYGYPAGYPAGYPPMHHPNPGIGPGPGGYPPSVYSPDQYQAPPTPGFGLPHGGPGQLPPPVFDPESHPPPNPGHPPNQGPNPGQHPTPVLGPPPSQKMM